MFRRRRRILAGAFGSVMAARGASCVFLLRRNGSRQSHEAQFGSAGVSRFAGAFGHPPGACGAPHWRVRALVAALVSRGGRARICLALFPASVGARARARGGISAVPARSRFFSKRRARCQNRGCRTSPARNLNRRSFRVSRASPLSRGGVFFWPRPSWACLGLCVFRREGAFWPWLCLLTRQSRPFGRLFEHVSTVPRQSRRSFTLSIAFCKAHRNLQDGRQGLSATTIPPPPMNAVLGASPSFLNPLQPVPN